jgi:hypothetical protein
MLPTRCIGAAGVFLPCEPRDLMPACDDFVAAAAPDRSISLVDWRCLGRSAPGGFEVVGSRSAGGFELGGGVGGGLGAAPRGGAPSASPKSSPSKWRSSSGLERFVEPPGSEGTALFARARLMA